MQLYFNLGNLKIPSYGLLIMLGVILANLIAIPVLKKSKLDGNNFILLEAYASLGAFIGAKGLFLFVSRNLIQWNRIFELNYFNQLMQGGFVFYGGLILAIFFILLAGKVHKINAKIYIEKFIFTIPLIHCFGRIGCFMAGCCYGVPYNGPGAVIFPRGSLAPAGIGLFPVQLAEAAGLLIITAIILFLQIRKNWTYTLETYLLLYALLRFGLEYIRYDTVRGRFLLFSTSQWISVLMVIVSVILAVWHKSKIDENGE